MLEPVEECDTLASYFTVRSYDGANRVNWASLEPRYEERFEFITRAAGVISPATKRFMRLAARHMSALWWHSQADRVEAPALGRFVD